jgi:hypothetical protein
MRLAPNECRLNTSNILAIQFTFLFIILFKNMPTHADRLRLCLGQGPLAARQLVEKLGISQPTVSRALAALGGEVVRIGSGKAIQYALRDSGRGLADIPVTCLISSDHLFLENGFRVCG